jgi:hypothetical protein
MKREPVLKIESLRKIPIQKIINDDGFEKLYNNHKIILNPVLIHNQTFLELICNDRCLKRFRIEEHTVGQLPYIREKNAAGEETIRRRSPMLVSCVVGSNNRRYRYLYFQGLDADHFRLGTRHDLGARYSVDCMSRKQRNSPERMAVRVAKQRKLEKRFERRLRKQALWQDGFIPPPPPPPPPNQEQEEQP